MNPVGSVNIHTPSTTLGHTCYVYNAQVIFKDHESFLPYQRFIEVSLQES
jgi:hypothetical protein